MEQNNIEYIHLSLYIHIHMNINIHIHINISPNYCMLVKAASDLDFEPRNQKSEIHINKQINS